MAKVFFKFPMASTGGGDVDGPGSATDNALVRFDGTTGKLLQNSGVTLDDNGGLLGVRELWQAEVASVSPVAAHGTWWTKNDTPNNPYFTDDAGTSFPLVIAPSGFTTDDLLLGGSVPGRPSRVPVGSILVDRSISRYTTGGSTNVAFPVDSSTPQNTEGAQITTVSHTAKSSTNLIRVYARMQAGVAGSNSPSWGAGIFKDTTANAAAAEWIAEDFNYSDTLVLAHEETAGDTSSHTWKLRAGPNNSGDSLRWNAIVSTGGTLFNNLGVIELIVEEYLV